MARISNHDAYTLGLLYSYIYNDEISLLAKDLERFHECIENNLLKVSDKGIYITGFCEEPIYSVGIDDEYNIRCTLKGDVDIERCKYKYIDSLPFDILVASQMENSLECLGIENENYKRLIYR